MDVLFEARRYAHAVNYSLKLTQESPELLRFPYLLGYSLLMLGRMKEAALAFGDADSIFGEALLVARSGDRELAFTKLAALRQRDGDMASYSYARIYARVCDKTRAFAALDRAWEVRDSELINLKIDPFLDPLRSDPRYTELVEASAFPSDVRSFHRERQRPNVRFPPIADIQALAKQDGCR